MLGGDCVTKKVFVYGSLMENFFNYDKYLVGKVLKRQPAKVRGKLYHLVNKGYPAMIKGNDVVYGELIEVADWENNVKDLDDLENYYGEGNPNNEYNRVLIEVEVLEDNSKEVAFTYMYNCKEEQELKNELYLPNGNWRLYKETTDN